MSRAPKSGSPRNFEHVNLPEMPRAGVFSIIHMLATGSSRRFEHVDCLQEPTRVSWREWMCTGVPGGGVARESTCADRLAEVFCASRIAAKRLDAALLG